MRVDACDAPRQGPAAPPGEMARARRPRAGVPPALPGPHRQPRVARAGSSCARGSSPRSAASSTRASSSRWRRPSSRRSPAARRPSPSSTHHNALGVDFFLRISLELYLKRLLVGGFDRVYEIGRDFPQRGDLPQAQPRIHDARGLPGLQRPPGDDGADPGHDRRPSAARCSGPTRSPTRRAARRSTSAGAWREVTYKDLIRAETGDPDWFSRGRAEHVAAAEKLGLKVEARLGGLRGDERDLLEADRAEPDPADLRPQSPEGAQPAGEDQPRGPDDARRLRAVHRGDGDRPGVFRAERPRRPARDVREAGRRGAPEHRPGLPARPRARHAARGRHGRRHRPALHAADRAPRASAT